MMPLPAGCSAGYEIRFYVTELTDEMGEWFTLIGGTTSQTKWYDHRGREQYIKHVQYGKSKSSYKTQDGTGLSLIRFNGTDASIASMFLIKFMDYVQSHNMKEYDKYVH